ncbi:FAD-binding dehydrogenase [Galactobacter valiniphilus]|uniref:FAD-binding dehydrogenase n=1 Tax=Galactobacter valiniphilus TaxID=2676122 RepID=A0A399J693_9MICC|nr:FAD-binding dehydrogenase [Galactobacter valiniphilus]RII40951.1 FAD-binding dehydrogenase [Galactobacter valiniphilus]
MGADVLIVGAGLAGLVAAHELQAVGRKVLVLDQENRNNLGGQAWWSFGGLFLVDTPQQRRLGVKDSHALAWSDWQGSSAFATDGSDTWGKRWAKAYVDFAAGEKAQYLAEQGIKLTPVVGWAERGDQLATGHGNSVPRFHVSWGTGTGVVAPFAASLLEAEQAGRSEYRTRHRVTDLIVEDGAVVGVRGEILAPDESPRSVTSSREVVEPFELRAPAVLVATGGVGGNHALVRELWPQDMGTPPKNLITGVPAHVDGSGLRLSEAAGAAWVHKERMWHYTEGIENFDPVWPDHGIRILPGPSPLWFDAEGNRLPAPNFPGNDTLGTLRFLRTDPVASRHDYSWFVLSQKMINKEFALSGSEQNPDITSGKKLEVVKARLNSKGAPGPVAAFQERGADFLRADTLQELVAKMNALTGENLIDAQHLQEQIEARDLQVDNDFTKDAQVQNIHNSRRYLGDKLMRTTSPHRILDPAAGPLVAVRLHILTRKSLGGLKTDMDARVLREDDSVLPGLWAAGEAAGFGGGGVHGLRALEGTFLGGCLFTGLRAGRAIHAALGGPQGGTGAA